MPLPAQVVAEIQDLAWAMADETISPEGSKRLEELLLSDPEARQLYVECMQLQADLYLFFNPKPLLPPSIPVGGPASKAPAVIQDRSSQAGGKALPSGLDAASGR